jgi:predicted DNA-binding protein (MmcQ/YjbR family)
MKIDQLRKLCLAFPGATEQIQWRDDLLFKVSGKMFAVTPLEPSGLWLSLKTDPQEFADLIERPGIIPAPYLARAKWIAIETPDALPMMEVAALLRKSYELVVAKLPRAARQSLSRKTKTTPHKSPMRNTATRKKRR